MNMPLTSVGADRRSDVPVVETHTPVGQPDAPVAAKPAPQVARPDPLAGFKATRKELEQALSEVNERMQRNGRSLAFSLDEKANRTVIRVTNSSTGEVVRQIPDETVLRIAHSIEAFKGMLYDASS